MNVRRFSLFRHRVGRDVRAWPMLALLLLVVGVAIGCVLWFMREAMRNEGLAVRDQLDEVYRANLTLVQRRVMEQWNRRLAQLDAFEPGPACFARCVRDGLADSVISLDIHGRVTYPRLSEVRNPTANAELFTLQSARDKTSQQFTDAVAQLRDKVNDYGTNTLPSAQRRFLMHELQRLDPSVDCPTLAAEELAARYLETNPSFPTNTNLRTTELRDVWSVASPGHVVVALFTTEGLRTKLGHAINESPNPKGESVTVLAPGEYLTRTNQLQLVALGVFGGDVAGWRLVLSLDSMARYNSAVKARVVPYLVTGCVLILAMLVSAVLLARGFGRQMQLARLKNDLVANVSHELKTPLTAMRALVDTLLDAEQFNEKTTREYLQLLAVENARLSRLIENFLTFSRLERNKFKFEFEAIRPQQIVEDAVAAMGKRIRNQTAVSRAQEPTPSPSGGGETGPGVPLLGGVRGGSDGLIVETAPNLPAIHGDADALVTALLNLLDNAWKYSGDEKRIVVRTEARNGNVCFDVEDNGIGLSPREMKRVFRRFYQTDQRLARVAGGCGLGLSIVQSIVEEHHGSVRVQSQPGHGSTFTIEIPALAEGAS